jgi:hypothetical protein
MVKLKRGVLGCAFFLLPFVVVCLSFSQHQPDDYDCDYSVYASVAVGLQGNGSELKSLEPVISPYLV